LITTYSAGLRVSEVLNLKIGDIDREGMCLWIKHGKCKKKTTD